MKLLDLFSGIGGFSLSARWMGWETVQFVELDKFCQQVLRKHWPNVPIHDDIKTFDGTPFRGAVDILTGGFPCQPFSHSGRRKGKDDDRYLWPEMLRVIDESKPTFVVPENVSGIKPMVDEICSDLESIGYTVEPIAIEAACIGADNLRERWWFVAYTNSLGRSDIHNEYRPYNGETPHTTRGGTTRESWVEEADELDSLGNPFLQFEERYGEPAIFGNYDGLSKKLDVNRRLRAIGNSIDPRIAFEIFKVIEQVR